MQRQREYFGGGSVYGRLMLLVGLLFLGPLIVLPFYPDDRTYAPAFLLPACISVFLGFLVIAVTYRLQDKVFEYQAPVQMGSLPVLFVWFYSLLLGSIPFLFTRQLNFVQALFESVSAWTTTSMTILDVAALPHIFLFYRSYIQFFGGIGFILVLSMFVRNRQTMTLYSAEGRTERVLPNVRRAARLIFLIYSIMIVVGSLLYRLAGVGLFEAICQTLSTVSTAGSSTRAGGFAEYGSIAVETITVVLMLIGASNFATLLVLTEGKAARVLKSTEVRFMFGLIALFIPLIALSLHFGMGESLGLSIRQAVFGVISVLSTTGYSIGTHYTGWPAFALGLIVLLMLIGGSSGSTSGGIKLIRTYFVLRITRESVLRQMSSAIRTEAPTYNSVREKVAIDRTLVADTFAFVACYLGILIVGSLLMTLTASCTLFEGMFEFAAALGTTGISIGLTNATTSAAALIVEMIGMILGRLEIFVVFFGIVSFGRQIKHILPR